MYKIDYFFPLENLPKIKLASDIFGVSQDFSGKISNLPQYYISITAKGIWSFYIEKSTDPSGWVQNRDLICWDIQLTFI